MHGSVLLAVDRQVSAMIWILRGKSFIDLNPDAGFFTRVHVAIPEKISMWEDLVGFLGVMHVFLNAEVVDAEVKMQRRAHAHGAQVRCAVRTGTHLIKLSQVRDLPEMSDAAGMNDR